MENERIPSEWGDDEGLVMSDDDGNEHLFRILATKEQEDSTYLLTVEGAVDEEDEEAEVVHFKCISINNEDDSDEDEAEGDMVFELIDEDHEDFDLVLALFKEEYKKFDIRFEE